MTLFYTSQVISGCSKAYLHRTRVAGTDNYAAISVMFRILATISCTNSNDMCNGHANTTNKNNLY